MPRFDAPYVQSAGYSEQHPRMDRHPSRTTPRAAYVTALPGVGIPTPPPAIVRASSSPMAPGGQGAPPGAAHAMLAPASWPRTYYDPAVGPAYVSTYPLTVASSPSTTPQLTASRSTSRSRSSSSGDSTAYNVGAPSMSRSGLAVMPPSLPPSVRLSRKLSGSAAAAAVPGPSQRSRDRSPRKGGRAKGDGDASDVTSAIVQAKSSGVSEWHMITAGGGDDDDGPPQPRDPLGPKRYSKYYQ